MSEDIVSRELTVTYTRRSKVRAVKDELPEDATIFSVSFCAPAGKITYLAGKNGSGKTTWIKAAVGLLPTAHGEVTYGGKSLDEVRRNFSIVMDNPPFYPHMSMRDNLRCVYDISEADIKSRGDLVENFQLADYMSERVSHLSFGKRHRLAVLGALLRRPKFLILDEPDIGLDPESWDIVSKELRATAEGGAAVLITGQHIELLYDITDHFIFLKDYKKRNEKRVRGSDILFAGDKKEFARQALDESGVDFDRHFDIRAALLYRMKQGAQK
ncbi:MAG: ABC transporter ATP-binding protein [Oscillospiraceae bacterium]|jgi:ABC-type multidrug transport system ATPase subunit|nr:ABC transporter ATP-binding protein [Oscillospiraceae bacterium]